ncbi:MAG: hypothetical protein OEY59_04185 [Deltaproteobacteria bacterium]|nr:hypothetical protein [Deltaproteobacteria bacterium]
MYKTRRIRYLFSMVLLIGILFAGDTLANEVRRGHRFLRPMAMGEAFTAVGDSMETIAYNPAGVLINGVEWSMSYPLIWFAYNGLIKKAINGDISGDDQTQIYKELPGSRIYLEQQLGFPFIFIPDKGVFFGVSSNNWFEFVFPKQTIIPVFHLEAISHNMVEYAMSFGFLENQLKVGANLKAIKRLGVITTFSLLRLATIPTDDPQAAIQTLQDEYNPDPPPIKYSVDFGMIYSFRHRYNPRIAFSAIDVGGVDFGSAGELKQLNSVGFAMTQKPEGQEEIYLTYSADYHDVSFSYFKNQSLIRRLSLGFEAAFGKNEENTNMLALQLGLKELKFPSFGFAVHIGIFKFAQAQWIENYGTEKNSLPDKRYSFLFSFEF